MCYSHLYYTNTYTLYITYPQFLDKLVIIFGLFKLLVGSEMAYFCRTLNRAVRVHSVCAVKDYEVTDLSCFIICFSFDSTPFWYFV